MALQNIPELSYSNCFKITTQVVRDIYSELDLTHLLKIYLKDYQQFL